MLCSLLCMCSIKTLTWHLHIQVSIPLWALVHLPVVVTITTAVFTPKGWLHCILYVLFENAMGIVKLWAVIAGPPSCWHLSLLALLAAAASCKEPATRCTVLSLEHKAGMHGLSQIRTPCWQICSCRCWLIAKSSMPGMPLFRGGHAGREAHAVHHMLQACWT